MLTFIDGEPLKAGLLLRGPTVILSGFSEVYFIKEEPKRVYAHSMVKTCFICIQQFNNSRDECSLHLLDHLVPYEGKSICPICQAKCGTHDTMTDRFLIAHGKLHKLVCPHPDSIRSFRTNRNLELHSRKHTKI